MSFPRVILATVLLGLLAPTAEASDLPPPRYYFLLFGGQSVPYIPRTAHTWATYVKATPTGAGPVMVEAFTISWLPVSGDVRIRNLRPVTGRNFTLEETFAVMARHRSQVSLWGPFEIDTDRYDAALAQYCFLEGGNARYRVLDSFRRNQTICHCVHAVTYADPVLKTRIQPVLRVGEPGTSRLAGLYVQSGAFLGGSQTHDWLIPALGIDRHPVTRRQPGEFVARQWL